MKLTSEEEEYYKYCLAKLEDWLEMEQDVMVTFGGKGGSYYYYEDEAIVISNKQEVWSQLFCLLHEAGHHMVRKESPNKWTHAISSKNTVRNKSYRVDVVREEVVAWERGEQIAKELGFWDALDGEEWNKYLRIQLYDYIKWTVSPRTFRGKK